jgi:hypothetical protein
MVCLRVLRTYLLLCSLVLFFCLKVAAQLSFQQTPTLGPYPGNAVAIGDLNGDGKLDVIVGEQGPTPQSTVFLGNGDGTFTEGATLSYSVDYVADFNGDGKLDVLYQCANGWCVGLGNGDGTFQSPINAKITADYPLIIADVNDDGKPDVLGYGGGGFLVFLGNGDGTFTAGPSYFSLPLALYFVAGDFNGDGKVDIAFAGPGAVFVMLGNGDGTFKAPVNSAGVASPAAIACGDLNGDGHLDLIVSDSATFQTFSLLGNGDGTFQAPGHPVPSFSVMNLAVADINRDGKLDLITNSHAGFTQILLGDGNGGFDSEGNAYFLPGVSGLFQQYLRLTTFVGDFNRDGNPDLVIGNNIFLGNSDGTFQGVAVFLPDSNPVSAIAGDFNADGKPDIAAITFWPPCNFPPPCPPISYSLNILLGDGKGGFYLAQTYSLPDTLGEPFTIASADLNGDGKLDLVIGTGGTTWKIIAFLGNGDGSFGPPIVNQGGNSPNQYTVVPAITVADFNGDHKSDLAVSGVNNSAYVMLSNGDGTFHTTEIGLGGGTGSLVPGDFNGDGKIDLVVATTGVGLAVLLGNGDGTFQQPIVGSAVSAGSGQLVPGDFNADGKLDLVAGENTYLGNGDGTFQTVNFNFNLPPEAIGLWQIPAADLNGDDRLDVAGSFSVGSGRSTTYYLGTVLGRGDGTFSFPDILWADAGVPLVVADFNQDNRPDIAWTSGQGIVLSLNITAPESTLSVSPASVNFGSQPIGSTSTATIILKNAGSYPVNVSGIETSYNPMDETFSASQNCVVVIASGSTCVISVTFTPTGIGPGTGTIVITDNTAFSPQQVSLSGAGASIGLVAAGSTSATVAAGDMATYDLSIGGLGWSGRASLTCTGAPKGAVCNSAPAVSVSATAASSVKLTVTTTARTTALSTPNRFTPLPWIWAVLLAGTIVRSGSFRRKRVALRWVRGLPCVLLLLFCACGGGSSTPTGPHQNPNGTPAGKYNLVVTASSGSMKQSIQLTLVVQ